MLNRVFFNQKPVKTLASLAREDRVWYASMLCKEIDCTYPHMMNILQGFEQAGLISTEGQGRIKIIRLTEHGEDLARDMQSVLRRIQKIEKQLGTESEPEEESEEEAPEETEAAETEKADKKEGKKKK